MQTLVEERSPALCHFYPALSPWNVYDLTLREFVHYLNFITELNRG